MRVRDLFGCNKHRKAALVRAFRKQIAVALGRHVVGVEQVIDVFHRAASLHRVLGRLDVRSR
jgi:hypothetical protein